MVLARYEKKLENDKNFILIRRYGVTGKTGFIDGLSR
jgi:hypothetical protein